MRSLGGARAGPGLRGTAAYSEPGLLKCPRSAGVEAVWQMCWKTNTSVGFVRWFFEVISQITVIALCH